MGLPQRVQELLARLGLGPRLQLGVLAAASIALLYFVIRWAVAPDWVPAFAGLPLEDVDRIVQRLDEEGIGYRMARGGSQLLVPAPELARARVALAAEGLPADGRPGFELFDQPSWGMTDFTQRINYRRALEGELERTIGKMRGVAGAKIHLTMHETSPFRRANRPAEASVVLRLAGAATPDGSIVRGIALLVASSVDGLVSDNVTVVDDTGRLLSASLEPGSLAGVSARHLEVRRDLERYLESKTEDLVE